MIYPALLLIFCAVGITGTVFFKRKFCETLPLTCLGITAVLYGFGLAGQLRLGAMLVLAALGGMLALSLTVGLLRDRKSLRKELSHPGLWLFLVLFLGIAYWTWGRMASTWDEFSHWMDSAKAMTMLDDFITNPDAHSAFTTYPPIMALWQYFVQVLNQLVHGGQAEFNEGLAYGAYQLFALSLFFPFFRDLSWKKPVACAAGCVFFLLPAIFFNNFYSAVYIDPFVAVLAGSALLRILTDQKRDGLWYLTLCLTTGACVLAKSVGMLFAVLIGVVCLLDSLGRRGKRRKLLAGSLPLLCAIAAKVSWKMEVSLSGAAEKFTEPYRLREYLELFFLENGSGYRQETVQNLKYAFFQERMSFGPFHLTFSYYQMTLAAIAAAVVVWLLMRRLRKNRTPSLVLGAALIQWGLYAFNIGVMYISEFSEREAVNLASYERYMNISFLVLVIVVVGALVQYLREKGKSWCTLGQIALLLVLLTVSPAGYFLNMLTREDVRQSRELRSRYEPLSRQILEAGDDLRVGFIDQESDGFDYWVTRYNIRPNQLQCIGGGTGSMGTPFYEGDVFSLPYTVEEFLEDFRRQEMQYLAVYHSNPYFVDYYGEMFADPGEIRDNTLFLMDEVTGKFILVP